MIVNRMRRPSKLAAGLIAALAAGGAAYGGWAASAVGSTGSISSAIQQDASEVSAVEAAFSQAIEADRSFGNPSAAYQTGVTTAINARQQPSVVPAAEQATLKASGEAAIARYFASGQVSVEQQHLNDGMAADADPNAINLGSGASKVQFLHVDVAGSQATVEADVTVWDKAEARQTPTGPWLVTEPTGIMDYTATLALGPSGTWQVTSLTGNFAPGSGP